MDNLKACPFCGSEAAIENDGLYRWAECQNERCRAMSHAFAFLVDAGNGDAIVAANWNTRPLEDAANARAEKAEARAERYEDALQQIDNWAKAYPLDVFPEPDFKRVRVVLEAAGITLDSVSSSNMRHVIKGVESIVEKAMKGGEE